MMKPIKQLAAIAVLIGVGGSGYAVYSSRETEATATFVTAPVTRGAIVDRITATGTLQAVTNVQVGTQVSGTVESLGADFNSIVKRGQVLARLDPALFQAQIAQHRANLIRAEAEVDRLRVALDDAQSKLRRANTLWLQELLPRAELDAAQVAVRSTEAQIRSAEAQVVQARATLRQGELSLQNAVITAPIDGIVLARNVDVGQTVAASMQAPTLFVLAADLTRMQVVANLDESDIGRIAAGQSVAFSVDAHGERIFSGVVAQVRLQPQTVQSVVTYAVLIDAPNPDLALKPGMTATVTIEVARRDDVLRLPAAALRFRPAAEPVSGPQVWRAEGGQLTAVRVTPGLSDGQFTELVDGRLSVGDTLVTRQATPDQPVRPAAASPFQFMQPPRQR